MRPSAATCVRSGRTPGRSGDHAGPERRRRSTSGPTSISARRVRPSPTWRWRSSRMGGPQLVTGELKALWRDAFAVEMSLSSRWLDLDRIAGAGEAAGPLESLIPLAVGMRDLLPAEGRSRATFAVDQANVGREAVSNVRLSLARSEGKLEIEEFRLGMPGGSRGELQGVVTGPPEAPIFDGSSSLRGTSVIRFLGWATGNALTFDAKGDGAFGIRSQLSIAAGQRGRPQCRRRPVGNRDSAATRGTAGRGGRSYPCCSKARSSTRARSCPADPASAISSMLVLHGPASRARCQQAPARVRRGQARLARRPDRCPHPRQRRAAHHGCAHLPRRGDGDRAQGRPPQVAAAARCRR